MPHATCCMQSCVTQLLGHRLCALERAQYATQESKLTNLQPALRSPCSLNGGAGLGGIRQPWSDANGKWTALQHLRQQESGHL
jgi:hypothetical protein